MGRSIGFQTLWDTSPPAVYACEIGLIDRKSSLICHDRWLSFLSEAAAFIATWGYFWTDLQKRQNGLNRISHPKRSLSKENRRSYNLDEGKRSRSRKKRNDLNCPMRSLKRSAGESWMTTGKTWSECRCWPTGISWTVMVKEEPDSKMYLLIWIRS